MAPAIVQKILRRTEPRVGSTIKDDVLLQSLAAAVQEGRKQQGSNLKQLELRAVQRAHHQASGRQ